MTEWLKGCEICDGGLCDRFNELIDSGKSIRSAGRILENEQKKKLNEIIYSAEALRKRYARLTPENKKTGRTVPEYETCTVADLESLVDSGQKFGTIYADPPWAYSNQGTRASTDNHYETMPIEDISALPIPQLTEDSAHLHLWTTNAFLFESREVLESWGFEYKSVFVWVKPQMGIGNYWRVSHEFMLLGVKGGLRFDNHSEMSWRAMDRTKHSKKPNEVANIIEGVSPGPRIELFGRLSRPGWTVWGNQIKREDFNIETKLR